MNHVSISFSVSDNYVQHMAVLVASLLYYSPRSTFIFHVLTKSISDENISKLRLMEEWYNHRCQFKIHLVDSKRFNAYPLPLEHITQEMYYRFLLPNLLADEARTIYMDVDILAKKDITPLWEYDLQGAWLGGVADPKSDSKFPDYQKRIGLIPHSTYFNSGVLLMDLEQLRQINFEVKCMNRVAELNTRLAWPDQDVINLIAAEKILPLPTYFNYMPLCKVEHKRDIVLQHYASFTTKPWCYIWNNTSRFPYFRFLLKTPFKNNAPKFIWNHIKGFFWYTYTKNNTTRGLLLGIRVYRKKH